MGSNWRGSDITKASVRIRVKYGEVTVETVPSRPVSTPSLEQAGEEPGAQTNLSIFDAISQNTDKTSVLLSVSGIYYCGRSVLNNFP